MSGNKWSGDTRNRNGSFRIPSYSCRRIRIDVAHVSCPHSHRTVSPPPCWPRVIHSFISRQALSLRATRSSRLAVGDTLPIPNKSGLTLNDRNEQSGSHRPACCSLHS